MAGIITRSHALAERLNQAGVPADRLRTVHNGVETDFFRPGDQPSARRALDLPVDNRIILYVGNLLPIKNPGLLLDAFSRLDEKPRLVYVGDGELRAQLLQQARHLGLVDRVHFMGNLAPEHVVRHMQAADVLAVPSRNEGLPNVLREAFACGLPVVAADVGGIREIVTENWLGTLVPSENPEALAAALASRLGQAPETARIRRHAEGFSWQRCVAECIAFVRERIAAADLPRV
jgi:glycosyltransferase involved in cell wall biosynthesis